MAHHNARKGKKPSAMPQPLADGSPVSADYVTGPTDIGEGTMPVEKTMSVNPDFKPGVFTGSHAGQFAGTMPEPGADKATRL